MIAPLAARRPRSLDPSSWGAMLLSFAVIVAAVAGLVLKSPKTAGALVYSYSLTEGQTRVYAMSSEMTFDLEGLPGLTEPEVEKMTAKLRMTVVDVRDDGSTVFEFKISDVKMSGSDALPGDETFRMHVGRSGEILSLEGAGLAGFDPTELFGGGQAGAGSIGSTNILPVFPDSELEPGDTWTQSDEIPLPLGKSSIPFTATGKHLGFTETDYGRAARVNMQMHSPLDVSFSFADIMGADIMGAVDMGAVDGATAEAFPDFLDQVRMILTGTMDGDMTARVIPEDGDLVAMVLKMKMDVAIELENVPAELSGMFPTSMDIAGDMVLKLDRIA